MALPQIPNRRRLVILEAAQSKREHQVPPTESFDPVKYIEHTLPKQIAGFSFDYWSGHPAFQERPDRHAFVDFTDGVDLVVREEVMEAAYRGDNESRFALAHEIGHVFLHRKKAKEILSRHVRNSTNQYSENAELELEANIFGGALLVPPVGVKIGASVFDIRLKYNCSSDVAAKAIEDTRFWRTQSK